MKKKIIAVVAALSITIIALTGCHYGVKGTAYASIAGGKSIEITSYDIEKDVVTLYCKNGHTIVTGINNVAIEIYNDD